MWLIHRSPFESLLKIIQLNARTFGRTPWYQYSQSLLFAIFRHCLVRKLSSRKWSIRPTNDVHELIHSDWNVLKYCRTWTVQSKKSNLQWSSQQFRLLSIIQGDRQPIIVYEQKNPKIWIRKENLIYRKGILTKSGYGKILRYWLFFGCLGINPLSNRFLTL